MGRCFAWGSARALVVAIAAISVAGCEEIARPEVARCEEYVLGKLRSPSTYKRIKTDVTFINAANPNDVKNPTEVWIDLEYDAANAFGTPVREKQNCKFPLVNGKPDFSKYIDFDAVERSKTEIEADNLEVAADNAVSEME